MTHFRSKVVSVREAVSEIADGAVVAVNSSSGLCCPDDVLKALGERFRAESSPRDLTLIHPIAAGDMFGTPGVDHLAAVGMIKKIIAGSLPSGPSSSEPPLIWRFVTDNRIAAYNVPSGIIFDMLREAAAQRPGVLTKVGMETFVDPRLDGCAMNALARQENVVERVEFDDDEWLYFQAIRPDVAIIRASTADERGNLTFEQEGAYLGALDIALATHNCGGLVIAQVKNVAQFGTLRSHDVHVPGIWVDKVVEAPDQQQTTATDYDPAISGELMRPWATFQRPEFNAAKIIARRVAAEIQLGWVVNVGFGISANVPRIFIENGHKNDVTWVIEQGAIGGVPLTDFKFGCSANAEALIDSPHQFTYFQAGRFDASLLSFLEIDGHGSVNVSKLSFCPHITAGAGGFVDITARAPKIVFSGYFNVGARLEIRNSQLVIKKEGRVAKFVKELEQVSFSGPRASQTSQDTTFVTERCVLRLQEGQLVVTEVAPGIDVKRDILEQAECRLKVADNVGEMDAAYFRP